MLSAGKGNTSTSFLHDQAHTSQFLQPVGEALAWVSDEHIVLWNTVALGDFPDGFRAYVHIGVFIIILMTASIFLNMYSVKTAR
jgi:hypothetical protein